MNIKDTILRCLFLALTALLPMTVTSQQVGWQWKNPYLQGNNLNCMVMNGSIGWAVGDMGTLMKTTNEGFDWELVDLGTSENFNSIYMDGISGRGWIVGNKGLIFFTDDGGDSWVKQRSGTSQNLTGITAIEGSCPWICGNEVILKSHDHGENWEWVFCPYSTYFLSIDLRNCDEAWLCGTQGLVISTTDEGATWQSHVTPATFSLYSIDIVDQGTYRTCGYAGTILSSDDGGSTWNQEYQQTYLYLYNVDTRGIGGPAYAVGGEGTILETLDGGTSWNKRESGVYTYLQDVCFQAIMHGVYATGWFGVILRKEDAEDAEFEIMNERPIHTMAGIDFINADTGWVVGGKEVTSSTEEGVIMRTTDGGETWEVQKTLADYLMSVDFINSREGWVVGHDGVILHTQNGGQTWMTQTSPISGLLTSVFFLDEHNGWVVSRDNWGEIIHTTNGGSIWTLQDEPSQNPFNDVFFINADTGWVVGMDSTILRTYNGGEDWLKCQLQVANNPYLRSVQFIDEHTGWTTGTGGYILMTTDGGVSWQDIHSGYSELLQSMYFTDPLNGWAVGVEGNILRTIDGGYTWFRQYSGTYSRYLTAVCFADPLTGWVAGEGGVIKKTTNGGFWNEPGVFQHTWMDLPILDHSETTDVITVEVLPFMESGYELVGLEFMLDSIIHPQVSDLEISLSHEGFTATFVSQLPEEGANSLWLRMKDDATRQLSDGHAPFCGEYRPDSPLSVFNGLDPDGDWVLTISDKQSGSTGSLKAWGIKPYYDRMVSVPEPPSPGPEQEILLFQNMPNPFHRNTRIGWISETGGKTTLMVYNLQGQEVVRLIDKYLPKGDHSVNWDGENLSPGVYYFRLQLGQTTVVKKCIKL